MVFIAIIFYLCYYNKKEEGSVKEKRYIMIKFTDYEVKKYDYIEECFTEDILLIWKDYKIHFVDKNGREVKYDSDITKVDLFSSGLSMVKKNEKNTIEIGSGRNSFCSLVWFESNQTNGHWESFESDQSSRAGKGKC